MKEIDFDVIFNFPSQAICNFLNSRTKFPNLDQLASPFQGLPESTLLRQTGQLDTELPSTVYARINELTRR